MVDGKNAFTGARSCGRFPGREETVIRVTRIDPYCRPRPLARMIRVPGWVIATVKDGANRYRREAHGRYGHRCCGGVILLGEVWELNDIEDAVDQMSKLATVTTKTIASLVRELWFWENFSTWHCLI